MYQHKHTHAEQQGTRFKNTWFLLFLWQNLSLVKKIQTSPPLRTKCTSNLGFFFNNKNLIQCIFNSKNQIYWNQGLHCTSISLSKLRMNKRINLKDNCYLCDSILQDAKTLCWSWWYKNQTGTEWFQHFKKAIPKFESPKVSKPDGYQACCILGYDKWSHLSNTLAPDF